MMWSSKVLAVSFGLIVACFGTTVFAGVLDSHPDAYSGWTGTSPFNDGAGLSGTVDYAVFRAADFNSNFPGLGYVPTDALVYAYQVINSGTHNVLAATAAVVNPASGIGQFDIGDIAAFNMVLSGGMATWDFTGIAPSNSSWGLAYSSPNTPTFGPSLTISGSSALALVPTPSTIPIPEPTTLCIALAIAVLVSTFRFGR